MASTGKYLSVLGSSRTVATVHFKNLITLITILYPLPQPHSSRLCPLTLSQLLTEIIRDDSTFIYIYL